MFIAFLDFASKYLTGSNLVEEVFILAYSLKGYSLSWQEAWQQERRLATLLL